MRPWPSWGTIKTILDAWLVDLRSALRGLRRTRGLSLAAVVVLSLGIGLNVAVFTIANAALFRGFRGVAHNERVVYLTTGRDCCLSYQDLVDWRGASSLSGIAAVADLRIAFDRGTGPETATATEITANTFAVLGVAPALGRNFTTADDLPGAPGVAILSHEFWRSHFDSASAALGRTVRVNGVMTTVVGIMPESFTFPQRQDLWLPLGPRATGQPRDARGLWFAVGRLADGVTLPQARAEVEAIGARMAVDHPATNARVRPVVQTFRDLFVGRDAVAVYGGLWIGVGLVLVVACANLANLLIARATARARDLAVRLALGAGRGRVARQQLLETAVLTALSAVVGVGVAEAIVRAYEAVAVPPTQPWAAQLLDYSMNASVLAYVAVVALVTGVVLGGLPLRGLSALDAIAALRDAGRGAVGQTNRRSTSVLVVIQVVLAVVLLSAAGVLLRSLSAVAGRDVGYDPSRVAMALTTLPPERYPDAKSQRSFQARLAAGVGRLPGVESVAFVDGAGGTRMGVEIDGRPVVDLGARAQARVRGVSPNYFACLGAPLVAGRDFDERDGTPERPAAIVSRAFAEMHWQTSDVVGRRVRLAASGGAGPWLTIAGVAPDVRHGDPARSDVEPALYVPLRQRPARSAWLLARTSLSTEALVASLRQQVALADPALPMWLGPYTMEQWTAATYWRRSVNGTLFTVFAGVSLVLACLGVFAVVAASVAHRTREIGVRLAVGAQPPQVVAMVIRQGLTPVFIGLAGGLVASVGINWLLGSQLVDVQPSDATTMAGVAAVLLVTTAVACVIPAMRATRIDPLVALRHD